MIPSIWRLMRMICYKKKNSSMLMMKLMAVRMLKILMTDALKPMYLLTDVWRQMFRLRNVQVNLMTDVLMLKHH
jgi:hypothetical protein